MPGRFFYLLLLLGVFSCSKEDFTKRIFDYQVERLLSGGDSKRWLQDNNSARCEDEIILYVELISSTLEDSLDISFLTVNTDCGVYDTSYIGRANASHLAETDVFTDSLIFSSGDYWEVEKVTSELLMVRMQDNMHSYTSL